MADVIDGTGIIDVSGGLGTPGSNVGAGGRARIEALTLGFQNGTVTPSTSASYASPGIIFPPANAPTVRVTSIDAQPVPDQTTGSFENPDVTINTTTAVTLDIEATNIPVGTVVTLTLRSESGTTVTVVSSALAGSLGMSTATAGPVTLPHGFTRILVTASWTP